MRTTWFFALSLAVLLSGSNADGTEDPVAPPNRISQAKVIAWGNPPSPVFVRQHVSEMEKLPFDGLVLTICANGYHDLNEKAARQRCFASNAFGGRVWEREDFSESIEALKSTRFRRFTDNFLRMNVTPGDQDWFADVFAPVENAGTLAAIAKETGCKGIMLDSEAYTGQLFNYKRQAGATQHTVEEFKQQVRRRGREFMEAVNRTYPDIQIIVSLAYSMAQPPGVDGGKYELLPSFLDGMLEAAREGAVLYDGWEFAYNFRTEKEFADTRKIIRETELGWSGVPEKMRQHWRAGFGIWLDYDRKWTQDPAQFQNNFFTPAEFAYTVHQAMKYTDRYVWIWSERADWWQGTVPQPYVDALGQARQAEVHAPPARQK